MIKITLALPILLVGSVTLTRLHAKSPAERILHVRGLVIEDDAGRPRITLGAPASNVGRKRQDAVTGLIFLAEDGTDRLTLGNTTAPQVNGKVRNRVAPGMGLLVNDPQGNERGGLGFLDSGRVVVGLDRADGREGAALIVNDDDRWSGLVVKDKGEWIVISLGMVKKMVLDYGTNSGKETQRLQERAWNESGGNGVSCPDQKSEPPGRGRPARPPMKVRR